VQFRRRGGLGGVEQALGAGGEVGPQHLGELTAGELVKLGQQRGGKSGRGWLGVLATRHDALTAATGAGRRWLDRVRAATGSIGVGMTITHKAEQPSLRASKLRPGPTDARRARRERDYFNRWLAARGVDAPDRSDAGDDVRTPAALLPMRCSQS